MPMLIPSNIRIPIERHATLVALSLYEQSEAARLFPLIANTPPRPPIVHDGQAKWYGLEGLATWREFVDERVINYLKTFSWWVDTFPLEYTEAVEALDEELGMALYKPIERAGAIMDGWARKVLSLCYSLFESNAVASIDGKACFAADHEHIFDRSKTYSNILTPERVDLENPSLQEMKNEVIAGMDRLRKNRIRGRELRAVVLDGATPQATHVAVSRDPVTSQKLRDLATEPQIVEDGAAVTNTLRGKFSVLEIDPPAGGATAGLSWQMVRADPGGPRPLIWLPIKNPDGIKFRQRDDFDSPEEEIVYGSYGRGGAAVAFPNYCVEVRPSEIAVLAGPLGTRSASSRKASKASKGAAKDEAPQGVAKDPPRD